jgi:hypothetical protein
MMLRPVRWLGLCEGHLLVAIQHLDLLYGRIELPHLRYLAAYSRVKDCL